MAVCIQVAVQLEQLNSNFKSHSLSLKKWNEKQIQIVLYKFSTIFNTLVKVFSLTTNNIYFLGSLLPHHCGGLGFPLPEYFEFIFPRLIYILFCRFFMLFTFLKLYKWYLIVQSISCASLTGCNSRLGSMRCGVPL